MKTSFLKGPIMLIVAILYLAGCATIDTRVSGNRHELPPLYPSTALDLRVIRWGITGCPAGGGFYGSFHLWWLSPIVLTCAALDLPISLVSDTLLLPYDGYHYRRARNRVCCNHCRDVNFRQKDRKEEQIIEPNGAAYRR